MSAHATISPTYLALSSTQSEIVREIEETLDEFQSVDILSLAGEARKKHWQVVTKFIALQMEFPEVAKQAYNFYHAESRTCVPSLTGYNRDVFNLMMELRTFATSTKSEDLTRSLEVLRIALDEISCYFDESY
jgi:hypothetical protein